MGGRPSALIRSESLDSDDDDDELNQIDLCQKCFLFEPSLVFGGSNKNNNHNPSSTASKRRRGASERRHDSMGSPMPETPIARRQMRNAAYQQVLDSRGQDIVYSSQYGGLEKEVSSSTVSSIPSMIPSQGSAGSKSHAHSNVADNEYPRAQVHEGRVSQCRSHWKTKYNRFSLISGELVGCCFWIFALFACLPSPYVPLFPCWTILNNGFNEP